MSWADIRCSRVLPSLCNYQEPECQLLTHSSEMTSYRYTGINNCLCWRMTSSDMIIERYCLLSSNRSLCDNTAHSLEICAGPCPTYQSSVLSIESYQQVPLLLTELHSRSLCPGSSSRSTLVAQTIYKILHLGLHLLSVSAPCTASSVIWRITSSVFVTCPFFFSLGFDSWRSHMFFIILRHIRCI